MALHIPTPTSAQYSATKDNTTTVTIEPCYPGYGTTLGNALRRVLLSSLPGSAVCAVKINGIQHEYDTIEHVREDAVQMMMNLKKLRVVCHSEEPVVLELTAKGEKEVTASDIKKNSDVDIVNTGLVLATLTDKKAELSMEITVKRGIGYEPVEDRTVDKQDIGTIQIDSLFSPVVNVGFKVEHVRVGQRTDFEKIVIDVASDGSMKAEDAVRQAVAILQEQFAAIVDEADERDDEATPAEDSGESDESADDRASDDADEKEESDDSKKDAE